MNSNIVLNKQANEFFLYSFFGIVDSDTPEIIIKKCVKRAYLDMNRTLTLNKSNSKNLEEKAFMNLFTGYLSKALTMEGTISDKRAAAYQVFVNHSEELSKYLEKVSLSTCSCKRNDNCFYYGQAQKWINMSLKYLWLLGMIPEEENDLLEAPIDSFIINAANFENKELLFPIDIDNPTDSDNKEYHSLCGNTMPWSKLDETEYNFIQEQVKKISSNQTVIEWECNAWINASERVRLGEAIKKERLRKGLTQKYIYDGLGVNQKQYSQIENGYCTVDANQLKKISEMLDCDFLEE